MVSGHKTRSVFDRYNMVSPDGPETAAENKRSTSDTNGHIFGTVVHFETKKEVANELTS